MKQFDFIGAVGTFMFLLVYIIIASSFTKSNKKFHKV